MTSVAADDGGVVLVALGRFSESAVTTERPAISPVPRCRAMTR